MTFAAFEHQMDRLSGLKFAPKNLQTHWEALDDLTPLELSEAIEQAQRDCDEFPSPKMLRAFVEQFRSRIAVPPEDWSRATPDEEFVIRYPPQFGHREIRVTHRWTYYCDDCSDTGMRSYWCADASSTRFPHLVVVRCQTPNCDKIRRGHPRYGHEWTSPCPCAETNYEVQRKKKMYAQVTRKQAER